MKKNSALAFLLSAVIAASSLAGCSGGTAPTQLDSDGKAVPASQGGTHTVVSGTPQNATGVDAQLTVSPGAWNNLQWTTYQHQYVTLQVPVGWQVTVTDMYQGGQTGSGTMVKVEYPGKNVTLTYMDFATFPSLTMKSNSIESFYRDVIAPNAEGVSGWTVTNSFQTEAHKALISSSSNNITDAKVITADYTINGKPCEGIYSGAIDSTLQYSGMLTVVSAVSIDVPKGTMANWESVMTKIMDSIQWTQACLSRYQQSVLTSTGSSGSGSSSIMEAWENRNKSEDILSQKRSDATLGYERVYDTTTNDIYQAPNGFYEQYSNRGGQRYQPITDDMYTQGYVGTIGF